jgi:oligopeptide transport system permease protein
MAGSIPECGKGEALLKGHFPLVLVLVIVMLALLLPFLLPWSYDQIDWDAVRSPAFSGSHIFGTDEIGRDRLARLAAGTRVTLMVAIAAALVSLIVGIAWGATAGWIGGRVDEAMMRIVDGLYALPFMFIVILLMVVFGRSILLVFVGIGLVEWLTMARVVRGQVMALKQRPFVLAAEAASYIAEYRRRGAGLSDADRAAGGDGRELPLLSRSGCAGAADLAWYPGQGRG